MNCRTNLQTFYLLVKKFRRSKFTIQTVLCVLVAAGTALTVSVASAHELAVAHQHALPLPLQKNLAGPFHPNTMRSNTRYYRVPGLIYQAAPPMTVVAPNRPPRRGDFVKDELLLVYDFGVNVDAVKAITKKYNLKRKEGIAIKSIRKSVVVADTQGQDPLDLQEAINEAQKAFEASTNNFFYPAATRSFKFDYPLAQTGVGRARSIARGRGVLIGMVDTPVDTKHSALRGANIKQHTIVDPKTSESRSHGTSIAGVLVSKHPQIGVAPDATLLSVSAFSSRPGNPSALRGKSSNIVKAIAHCIDKKVDILNLSFTGGRDNFLETIVREAVRRGITVVAAGGNRGRTNSSVYPAMIKGVVGVTAVDRLQRRYQKADRGRFIDIAAPGVNIYTLAPGGRYQRSTGTSMAAAHLSGVMALMKGYRRNYKPSQLNQTAIDLGNRGRDIDFGSGLVNVSAALRQLGAPLPY